MVLSPHSTINFRSSRVKLWRSQGLPSSVDLNSSLLSNAQDQSQKLLTSKKHIKFWKRKCFKRTESAKTYVLACRCARLATGPEIACCPNIKSTTTAPCF